MLEFKIYPGVKFETRGQLRLATVQNYGNFETFLLASIIMKAISLAENMIISANEIVFRIMSANVSVGVSRQ